jgi:hypothetical protein
VLNDEIEKTNPEKKLQTTIKRIKTKIDIREN